MNMKYIGCGLLVTIFLMCGAKGKAQEDKSTEIAVVKIKLDVEVIENSVRFLLEISNDTDTRAVLQFPTSQQYDFIVKTEDDKMVWQWSNNRMFTQTLTEISLDPGEIRQFTEEHSFQSGKYKAQGLLPAAPENICTEWKEYEVIQIQGVPPINGKITKILDKIYILGEDGNVYLVVNPADDIIKLQNKNIEATSYRVNPIEGTTDMQIEIIEYKKE